MIAKKFNLAYEIVQGTSTLVKKLLYGPWDEDFVVASPGQTIELSDFYG